MTGLIEALTLYAAEHLIPRFQKETAPQVRAAQMQADKLSDQLKALSPEAEDWMKKLTFELDTISIYHERAVLLAGISIGLELGRL